MLKIRLQRVGRKNDPSFRIIVTEHARDSQSANFIEILGAYDARHGAPQINAERVQYWLSKGAQASGTVHNLLVDAKILSGKKINVLPKKTPPAKKAEPAPAPEAVPPAAEPAPVPEVA